MHALEINFEQEDPTHCEWFMEKVYEYRSSCYALVIACVSVPILVVFLYQTTKNSFVLPLINASHHHSPNLVYNRGPL